MTATSTVTLPAIPVRDGVVTWSWVGDRTTRSLPSPSVKSTPVTSSKLVPVMVTRAPAAADWFGEMLEIVGGGGVYWNRASSSPVGVLPHRVSTCTSVHP